MWHPLFHHRSLKSGSVRSGCKGDFRPSRAIQSLTLCGVLVPKPALPRATLTCPCGQPSTQHRGYFENPEPAWVQIQLCLDFVQMTSPLWASDSMSVKRVKMHEF